MSLFNSKIGVLLLTAAVTLSTVSFGDEPQSKELGRETVKAFDVLNHVLANSGDDEDSQKIQEDVAEWQASGNKVTNVSVEPARPSARVGGATVQVYRFTKRRHVGFIGRELGGATLVVKVETRVVPDAEQRRFKTSVQRLR